MTYDNPATYIQAAQSLRDRIDRITTVIDNLETCAIQAASNSDVQNYSFNDGQSQIATSYRSIEDLGKAIQMFDMIRTRLINRLNGRVTVLRDADITWRYRWGY
jgi:hypothetical protein